MPPRFPIGESDFQNVRIGNYYYVDKSWLIHDLVQSGAKVLLLPRPRRFGKTLNLSMLRYFFEKPHPTKEREEKDRRNLFAGLAIEKSEFAWEHFQKYPVIFLTFKDIKEDTWESCFHKTKELLAHLYQEHQQALEPHLSPVEKTFYTSILEQKAEPEQCSSALLRLSDYLSRFYQQPVFLLLDEYDSPLNRAFTKGYYEKAITFFRTLLSSCLKDNPYLYRAVVTGILRVARESIFSGLNNLAVYSILQPKFSKYFGFTGEEVKTLTQKINQPELMEGIQTWYNGYHFFDQTVYNPWSVLSFLDNVSAGFRPYWVSTATTEMLEPLLFQGDLDVRQEIETLLQGGFVSRPVQENIVFSDLKTNENTLWNLLLFSGYLTSQKLYKQGDRDYVDLVIPNREVGLEFQDMTQKWFALQLGDSSKVKQLVKALLEGNAEGVQEYLGRLLVVQMSSQDVKATKGKVAEAVYHAFFLGLLSMLEPQYEVRSNRESGHGLYDLMILPKEKNRPGVVLELKALDFQEPKSKPRKKGQARLAQTVQEEDSEENELHNPRLKKAIQRELQAALDQIQTRQYITELKERGAHPIHCFAVVFYKKYVFIKK